MARVRMFVVRDVHPTVVGREVARAGDKVTLNIAPMWWPFPKLAAFHADCLIYAGCVGRPTQPRAEDQAKS